MSRKRKKGAAAVDPADREAADQADHIEETVSGAQDHAQEGEIIEAEPPESQELQELRDRLAAERDRLLRTAAELDNVRKRGRREVADARRFAQADILRPLLDVLDNFERALQHAPAGSSEKGPAEQRRRNAEDPAPDTFGEGISLIAQNFRQVLRDCGVSRIEAVGSPFDPALHEAVGQAPADQDTPSGTVLSEVQAGYLFGDLVLRASRVIVAQ
jgi:molecular chaperone GrpE